MRALSIRQPFAELILRGIKTAEFRTRPTRIIGERFYIYASKGGKWNDELGTMNDEVKAGRGIRGDNIAMPGMQMPEWMIELAEQIKLIPPELELPRGVIVGSAVISKCEARRHEGTEAQRGNAERSSPSCLNGELAKRVLPVPSCLYEWHLTDIQRAKRLRKPKHHPQPVWFNPFD